MDCGRFPCTSAHLAWEDRLQIIMLAPEELRAVDTFTSRAAPGGLTPRDTYQQIVQTRQGSLLPPAGPGQRPDPLR